MVRTMEYCLEEIPSSLDRPAALACIADVIEIRMGYEVVHIGCRCSNLHYRDWPVYMNSRKYVFATISTML